MMKALLNKNWNYLINSIAVLFGLFVLLPFKAKPYLVVLLFLVSALSYFYKKGNEKRAIKKGIPILLLFIIALVSLCYTSNLNEGWKIIGRMIPLALPLAFCLLTDDDRDLFFKTFRKVFVPSCVLYTILIFIYLNQLGCFSGDMSLNYGYSYIMFEFWGINDHPIYISTYFVIALFFLLEWELKPRIVSYLLFIILFSGLLILSRKGSIISFLLCVLVFFFSKKSKGYWIKGSFIIVLISLCMMLIPEIKYRFLELVSVDRIVENPETSTGIRYIVWKTSAELIQKAPVLGYGIGDVQDVLNQSYIDKEYDQLAVDTYNAHNQFIQIVLSSGIIGLVLFLAGTIFLYRQFIASKEKIGLLILTFFLIVFLTESYLERQNGIIFYSLIMSMFIYKKART